MREHIQRNNERDRELQAFQRMNAGLRELTREHEKEPYRFSKFFFRLPDQRFASISSGTEELYSVKKDTEQYISLALYDSLEDVLEARLSWSLSSYQRSDGDVTVQAIDHSIEDQGENLGQGEKANLLLVYEQLTSQPDKAVVCDDWGGNGANPQAAQGLQNSLIACSEAFITTEYIG